MGPPRGFGVSGRSWLRESWTCSPFGPRSGCSLFCCETLPGRLLRLLCLLDDLNNPPNPPLLPAALLTESSPLDFFRDKVKDPRSLLAGEGVRSCMGGVGGWSALSGGSTIWGTLTFARGSAVGTASGDVTMSDPGTTELVWALISGDEKVKYPACD